MILVSFWQILLSYMMIRSVKAILQGESMQCFQFLIRQKQCKRLGQRFSPNYSAKMFNTMKPDRFWNDMRQKKSKITFVKFACQYFNLNQRKQKRSPFSRASFLFMFLFTLFLINEFFNTESRPCFYFAVKFANITADHAEAKHLKPAQQPNGANNCRPPGNCVVGKVRNQCVNQPKYT